MSKIIKNENEKVLEVKDLKISFKTNEGIVKAVRGVSFDLYKGETLTIVGESGSGKSVSSRAIMGILAGNAIVDEGTITYQGQDLIKLREDEFHKIRGTEIGMIFQDPTSSLNPILRVGKQISEGMLVNGKRKKNKMSNLIKEQLQNFTNAKYSLKDYKTNYNFKKNKSDRISNYKLEIKQVKANQSIKQVQKKELIADNLRQIEILKNSSPILSKEERKSNIKAAKMEIKKFKNILKEAKKNAKKEINLEYKEYKKDFLKDRSKLNAFNVELAEKLRELKQQHKSSLLELKQKFYKDDIKKIHDTDKEKYNKEIIELKNQYSDDVKTLKEEKNDKVKFSNFEYQISKVLIPLVKWIKGDFEFKGNLKQIADLYEKYLRKIKVTKLEAKEETLKIMNEVGIPEPEKRIKMYPFQFSGGMKQRIVIAIALTTNPRVLICDEPTTALDVTIQAQILELLKKLKQERDLSLIFITHNLGVVANMADRVAVMYAGKIVEFGKLDEVFYNPKHPYTWALLSSIPDLNSESRLLTIPGTPPNMLYPPKGDAFAQRNANALEIDFKEHPPLFKVSDTHYAATWLLHENAPNVEPPSIIGERRAKMEKIINKLKKDKENASKNN